MTERVAESVLLCHPFTMLKQRLYMVSEAGGKRRWSSDGTFLNWFGLPTQIEGRPIVILGLEPFGYVTLATNPAPGGVSFIRGALQNEMERFFPPREPAFAESVALTPALAGKVHMEEVPERLARRLKTAENFVSSARSLEDAGAILHHLNLNPLDFGGRRVSSQCELQAFAADIKRCFDGYVSDTSLPLQILHRLVSIEPWMDSVLAGYEEAEGNEELGVAAP